MVIFIFSFHQYLPGLWPLLGQNLCNHDTLESELDRFILSNAGSIVYYYYMYYHPIGNTWWECLKLVKNGKFRRIIPIFSFADQMWNDVKLISKRYWDWWYWFKMIIPISFQVGHLEVEDSVFHKLKMESCPIEIPDSKVKHQDGVIYLKWWGTSFWTLKVKWW